MAAAFWAAACTENDVEPKAEVLLRVGTSHGMGSFLPGASRTGGAAFYLDELLHEPILDYAEVDRVDGERIILQPEDAESAEVLVEALAHHGLDEVEHAADGEVLVTFRSAELAARAAIRWRNNRPAVATGPYRLSRNDESARLEARRAGMSIDAIEIQSLPTTELWRRLHGRDIDVIPILDAVHRAQFEDMYSVRTLDLPVAGYPSLVFNTRHPGLAERAVRARLATMLDREAIARVACGSEECVGRLWSIADGLTEDVSHAELPDELNLLVLESDSSLVLAAEVVRHQLRAAGLTVKIVTASLEELLGPGVVDYDLLLVPLPAPAELAVRYLEDFGTVDPGLSERLDIARDEDDERAWERALAAEMPAFPLFEGRHFAAVDSRFCGGNPDRASSWAWLAELHPCEVASR